MSHLLMDPDSFTSTRLHPGLLAPPGGASGPPQTRLHQRPSTRRNRFHLSCPGLELDQVLLLPVVPTRTGWCVCCEEHERNKDGSYTSMPLPLPLPLPLLWTPNWGRATVQMSTGGQLLLMLGLKLPGIGSTTFKHSEKKSPPHHSLQLEVAGLTPPCQVVALRDGVKVVDHGPGSPARTV